MLLYCHSEALRIAEISVHTGYVVLDTIVARSSQVGLSRGNSGGVRLYKPIPKTTHEILGSSRRVCGNFNTPLIETRHSH